MTSVVRLIPAAALRFPACLQTQLTPLASNFSWLTTPSIQAIVLREVVITQHHADRGRADCVTGVGKSAACEQQFTTDDEENEVTMEEQDQFDTNNCAAPVNLVAIATATARAARVNPVILLPEDTTRLLE